VDGLLANLGWTVVRIWEHAAIDDAAGLVARAVGGRETTATSPSAAPHR
jgi:hypothetical protein